MLLDKNKIKYYTSNDLIKPKNNYGINKDELDNYTKLYNTISNYLTIEKPNEFSNIQSIITKDNICGKAFEELINKHNLQLIVRNFDDIFDKLPEKRKKKIRENKIKNCHWEKTLHDELLKLLKRENYIEAGYPFSIYNTTYNYAKNKIDICAGRLFSTFKSLSNLPREFRNCVINPDAIDVDISNAHPNLYQQYCKKNGIKTPYLDKYVNNRNEVLESISKQSNYELSKADVKEYILTSLNGGIRTIENSELFYNLTEEFSKNNKLICEIQKNADLFKIVKRRKHNYNVFGSTVNHILCDIECDILISCLNFNKHFDIITQTLMFDGFLISHKSKDKINDEYLINLSKYVNYKIGYDVKFIVKPIAEKLDLSLYENKDKKKEIIFDALPIIKSFFNSIFNDMNDIQLEFESKKLLEIFEKVVYNNGTDYDYGNFIKYLAQDRIIYSKLDNKETTYFCDYRNIWIKDEANSQITSIINNITEFFETYGFKFKKFINDNLASFDTDEIEIYKEKQKQFNRVISSIKSHSKRCSLINFCKSMFLNNDKIINMDENPFLLAHTNCLIDFKICKIRKIQPNDLISLFIDREFIEDNVNQNDINQVHAFFKSVLDDDVIDYLMNYFAKTLCGDDPTQTIIFATGNGANGKTMMFDTLIKALFGNYYQSIKSQTLCNPPKTGMEFSEFSYCKGKRIATTNEPDDKDNSNSNLNSTNIKVLVNGRGKGKIYKTRGFGKDNFDLTIQFNLVMTMNTIPTLASTEYGILRRIIIIHFKNTFCDENKYNQDKDIEKHLRLKDDTIEDKLKSPQFLNAFMSILIKLFFQQKASGLLYKYPTPPSIENASKFYFESCNELNEFVNKHYNITRIETDIVRVDDVFSKYIDDDFNNKHTKFGKSKTVFSKKFLMIDGIKSLHKKTGNFYTGLTPRIVENANNEFINDNDYFDNN